jgi:outer membrane protein TolC
MRTLLVLFLSTACAFAETKIMTLREAIDLALSQNPDLMLARLDQQKAREQITIAKDPFQPKVTAGSGAVWTSGFPASVDGSAPAIIEAKTQMALFDQPQRYQIASAKESLRGSEIDVTHKQDEVLYRVVTLYLDAQQIGRSVQAAGQEIVNLRRIADMTKARVDEGRAPSIDAMGSERDFSRMRTRADGLALDLMQAETSLAIVLGMKPDDRVQAAPQDGAGLTVSISEDDSVEQALENSPELKRLESNMQVKSLEIKGYNAQRLPKVNLVAQFEVYSKSYYQNYYSAFQRTSGQLGASIEIPVLVGRSARAYKSQAELDIEKLRIQTSDKRAHITADVRHAFQEVMRAENYRDFARKDLDYQRELVNVSLAQQDEGRLSMQAVEQARALEQEKWLAYYESQHTVEVAKLNVLRQTGTLLAAVR